MLQILKIFINYPRDFFLIMHYKESQRVIYRFMFHRIIFNSCEIKMFYGKFCVINQHIN